MHVEPLAAAVVQDRLLEIAFEVLRLTKRLGDLKTALPVAADVVADIVHRGSPETLESELAASIPFAMEQLEETAMGLLRLAKVSEAEIRRESHQRWRERSSNAQGSTPRPGLRM